jgi:hypothetical protein
LCSNTGVLYPLMKTEVEMPGKSVFFERVSGPFNRGYDRWYLIPKDDGTFAVEHSWLRPAVTVDGSDEAGSTVINAGWFFATVSDEQVLGALRRAITTSVMADFNKQLAHLDLAWNSARQFDPLATVVEWLSVCRTRDLDRLMTFYDSSAKHDCACTNEKLCNGKNEVRDYWRKHLADPAPSMFLLQDVWPRGDATALDYVSHKGQVIRSFFYFGENGLITQTRCGPIDLAKAG